MRVFSHIFISAAVTIANVQLLFQITNNHYPSLAWVIHFKNLKNRWNFNGLKRLVRTCSVGALRLANRRRTAYRNFHDSAVAFAWRSSGQFLMVERRGIEFSSYCWTRWNERRTARHLFPSNHSSNHFASNKCYMIWPFHSWRSIMSGDSLWRLLFIRTSLTGCRKSRF